MINSLYNSAAALNSLAKQHENTAKNLANVNTPGHRRFVLPVEGFNIGDGYPGAGVGPEAKPPTIDFSFGNQVETSRALDFSIEQEGFFVVANEEGTRFYSRDGRFFRDPVNDYLINSQGMVLQGENGPIEIESSIGTSEIRVNGIGEVRAGDRELGKLLVVDFADKQKLEPFGQAHFLVGKAGDEQPTTPSIAQGKLEMSNTNPVKELISLIVGSRQYESIQKASKSISDALREHIRT